MKTLILSMCGHFGIKEWEGQRCTWVLGAACGRWWFTPPFSHECALSHLQGTRGPGSSRGARGAWLHCLQYTEYLHFLFPDRLDIVFHLAIVWKWGVGLMNPSFDSAFETHVDYCRMRMWSSIYRPIWETNPALSQVRVIRGTTSPSGLILVDTPNSEEHVDDAQPVSGLVRFRQKRNATDMTWAQQLNTQRVAAITKWVKIILTFPAALDLGCKWDKDAPLGASIVAGLKHVFSGKATGTLHNRAGPILRFIQWCHAHGVIPFPVREQHVYEFMKAVGFEAAPTFLVLFGVHDLLQLYFGVNWIR